MEDYLEQVKEREALLNEPVSEEDIITKPQFDKFVSVPSISDEDGFITKDNKLANIKNKQMEKLVDMVTYTKLVKVLDSIEEEDFTDFMSHVFNLELTLSSSVNATERKLQTTQGYRFEKKKDKGLVRLFGKRGEVD